MDSFSQVYQHLWLCPQNSFFFLFFFGLHSNTILRTVSIRFLKSWSKNTSQQKQDSKNCVRITAVNINNNNNNNNTIWTIFCWKCCCLCVCTVRYMKNEGKITRIRKRNRLNKIHRNSFLTAKKLILTWVIVPLDLILFAFFFFHNIINQERCCFPPSHTNSKRWSTELKV